MSSGRLCCALALTPGLHPDRLGENCGRERAGLVRPPCGWGWGSGSAPSPLGVGACLCQKLQHKASLQRPPSPTRYLWELAPKAGVNLSGFLDKTSDQPGWGSPFLQRATPQTGFGVLIPWTTEGGLARRLTLMALRTPETESPTSFTADGDKSLIPPLSRCKCENKEASYVTGSACFQKYNCKLRLGFTF